MIENFRVALAKLLGSISFLLVFMLGMLAGVSIGVTVLRGIIGALIMAAMGYYMGEVMEKKREIYLMNDEIERVKEEKQRLKAQIAANVEGAVNQADIGGSGKENIKDDFAPLNVENLTRIIVDSLNE